MEVIKNSVSMTLPCVCYAMTDGPFRNVWIRFGFIIVIFIMHRYNPSLDSSSWKYQYVEFRFSKRPMLKDAAQSSDSLPELYAIPLNLHNRYPLYVLQVWLLLSFYLSDG